MVWKAKEQIPTGVDAYFNWTATTDALRYWGSGAGSPYIAIHNASGTEIAYSTYNQDDVVFARLGNR